jgi:hypothetical protein
MCADSARVADHPPALPDRSAPGRTRQPAAAVCCPPVTRRRRAGAAARPALPARHSPGRTGDWTPGSGCAREFLLPGLWAPAPPAQFAGPGTARPPARLFAGSLFPGPARAPGPPVPVSRPCHRACAHASPAWPAPTVPLANSESPSEYEPLPALRPALPLHTPAGPSDCRASVMLP